MKEISRKAWANLFVFNLTTGPDGRFPATADELQVLVEEVYAQAAQHEREACLAECQHIAQGYESAGAAVGAFGTPREGAALACCAAIRSRGTVRPTDSERKEGDDE